MEDMFKLIFEMMSIIDKYSKLMQQQVFDHFIKKVSTEFFN